MGFAYGGIAVISRCPSCAAQVDDEAPRCPSCHWDFAARRRILPGEAPQKPHPPQKAEFPKSKPAPLELHHFADILEDAPPPPKAIDPPKPAAKPLPVEKSNPAASGAQAAKPKRAPMRILWALAALVALIGLGTNVWRLLPAADDEPTLPAPTTAIAFAKHEEAQPAPAVAKPAAKEAPAPEWTFQGTAFDVLTLRPVALADLAFEDGKGGEAVKATTDGKGRFSIKLPARAEGYRLTISHPDYSGRYLDDLTPSIRLADQKMRRQLAKAFPKNESWAGPSVKRDIALVPSAGN